MRARAEERSILMFYSIRHVTRFRYSRARARKRDGAAHAAALGRAADASLLPDRHQSARPALCLYRSLGNAVYHFNVLREHEELRIEAQAVVEIAQRPEPPADTPMRSNGSATTRSISPTTISICWSRRNSRVPSPALREFMTMRTIWRSREGDPLTALRHAQQGHLRILRLRVGRHRSPFADRHALKPRRGVCQDFAHIMIAIARSWGIPTRYVSGYLHHRRKGAGPFRRRTPPMPGWKPICRRLGWLGFDPTNNIDGRRAPYPRRGRPRLCRRAADARHLQGRRGNRTRHRGLGRADPGAGAPRRIPARRPPAETTGPRRYAAERLYHQQQQQQ